MSEMSQEVEMIPADLLDVLDSVDAQISNPGAFCSVSPEYATSLSLLMRNLFKASADSSKKTFGPFQELLVEGFDGETIWEELQTRNRPLTRFVRKKMGDITVNVKKNENDEQMRKNAIIEAKKVESIRDEDEIDEIDESQDSDDDDDDEVDADSENGEESDNAEDDDEGEDGDEDIRGIDLEMASDEEGDDGEYEGGGDAEYDDIDGMQAWLDQQEELEEKHEKKLLRLQKLAAQKGAVEEGPDSDDEEDDMLFVEREMYEDHESDGDNDDEDMNDAKKGSSMRGSEIKYEDFFRGGVSKKSAKDTVTPLRSSVKKSSKKKGSKKDKEESDEGEGDGDDESDSDGDFDEAGGDDYDFGDDDDEEGEGEEVSAKVVRKRALTTHEKRDLKMAAQIAEIESELIAEKPWEMRGEIKSLERPENSLLEITAQVERASKSAPMATEEFTSSLEEMIIKRIREEQYDDVVLKETPDDVIGTDDREDLSQEKSRLGLGEVYAEAFLATATSGKSGAKEAKDSAVRDELKELYHKVCRQLDGLSHFHFAPKPVVLEPRVQGLGPEKALPSLSLEDLIPTTENSATVLAPEEIKDRKRGRAAALVADEELSRDDKRRLRRASKTANKKQKKSENEAEKRSAITDGSSAGEKARRRQEEKKTEEVLRADHRVVEGTEEGGSDSYAKSAVFFSNLQRTAQEAIGGVTGKGGKDKKGKKKGFDPDTHDPLGPKKKASGFKL